MSDIHLSIGNHGNRPESGLKLQGYIRKMTIISVTMILLWIGPIQLGLAMLTAWTVSGVVGIMRVGTRLSKVC